MKHFMSARKALGCCDNNGTVKLGTIEIGASAGSGDGGGVVVVLVVVMVVKVLVTC